jgi:hypothetical protein
MPIFPPFPTTGSGLNNQEQLLELSEVKFRFLLAAVQGFFLKDCQAAKETIASDRTPTTVHFRFICNDSCQHRYRPERGT